MLTGKLYQLMNRFKYQQDYLMMEELQQIATEVYLKELLKTLPIKLTVLF
jgi:hypothetical protein